MKFAAFHRMGKTRDREHKRTNSQTQRDRRQGQGWWHMPVIPDLGG